MKKDKPKKTKRATLRLTETMHWRLDIAADEEHHDRSVNWVIRRYIQQGLDRDKIPKEKPK